MVDIKVRAVANKGIKTIDKGVVATQKLKDNIVEIKEKTNNATQKSEDNAVEYGSNRVNTITAVSSNKAIKTFDKQGQKSLMKTKENIMKSKAKIKNFKETRKAKQTAKNVQKTGKTAIKTSKEVVKKSEKVAKESAKASKRAMQMAKQTAKATAKSVKVAVKATISMIKGIIAGTKALISAIIAGGWVAVVIIIIICLIGLLCSSIFGIFFSSEKSSGNSMTMNEVVAECNKEFYDKLENIQNSNPHDSYVLDGNMASWKDILTIYSVKQTNGVNSTEVMTLNEAKKNEVKKIFWDMNSISSEVKTETVTEQGTNTTELPKQVSKRVLHITITSKTLDQMKQQYSFSSAQNNQIIELTDNKYANLWSGVIYGSHDIGDYVSWRQGGQIWSNIKIGNTNSTIGQIGCLVTSIAILIEKSGVNTTIDNFNPGTFVEALNKNGGFDGSGNLQYAAVNKAVPGFKYAGNVNLRNKTRDEKLSLINQYLNEGYYITAEVKGATPGNQHWVAVTGINGLNVNMVDPGSSRTDMWSAYEMSKTSQFNYFKVE